MVKRNGPNKRTGSDGGPSLYIRFQTKSLTGNSELFGNISGFRVFSLKFDFIEDT